MAGFPQFLFTLPFQLSKVISDLFEVQFGLFWILTVLLLLKGAVTKPIEVILLIKMVGSISHAFHYRVVFYFEYRIIQILANVAAIN